MKCGSGRPFIGIDRHGALPLLRIDDAAGVKCRDAVHRCPADIADWNGHVFAGNRFKRIADIRITIAVERRCGEHRLSRIAVYGDGFISILHAKTGWRGEPHF